ncbi:sigma-70 family RNA polymerase sigma factor [Streptomonospora sp. S1-112]|uniref:Sigma-70 family RNA polymerase sigma factor n=1 Tax=Streptomonospora mangrovi TaxID=2883123 RepID=A0A9X3SQU2_9ACTN|nr:sigma-70 family RNA polymerase sigma factor [Streptomonospora mangrovi]MDA0566861.1 sigma-70 family RNA polymerase sigma factor [Streptomonospora mangrovi]
MSSEYERIAAIENPFALLRAATERLGEAQQEVTDLARLRRRTIQELHAQGLSYAQIAAQAGLSRGRIHQIRHTGPAPEGAFFGSGTVTVITPLRPEPGKPRAAVSLDDVNTGKRLEDLARSYDLTVRDDHVGVDGSVDLNRPGLVVVCGPRMSEAMRDTYAQDPVFRWEREEGRPWCLRDTRTGEVHFAGSDQTPPSPSDLGYLGRLPRPDGAGSLLAIAGIHPAGSLGVAHWLTTDIATLWGQVGDGRFSVLIRTEYDPDTNEPVKTEMATPLYRHDGDTA